MPRRARRPRRPPARPKLEPAAWWTVRRAQNRKPATYRCPLCGGFLPALSEHALIAPEGDMSRRRHAHSACVARARKSGRLPAREDWQATQPAPPPGPVRRALRRVLRRGGG